MKSKQEILDSLGNINTGHRVLVALCDAIDQRDAWHAKLRDVCVIDCSDSQWCSRCGTESAGNSISHHESCILHEEN